MVFQSLLSGGGDGGEASTLESGGLDNDKACECCPALTYKQRITGFAICLGVGFLLSFMGSLLLFFGNYVGFAILYTMGNCTAIGSSMFLMGPMKQLAKMFDETRRLATIVYLGLIVAVLVFAFLVQGGAGVILIFILVILQFMAGIWYSASYFPYGRQIIKSTARGICCQGGGGN